MKITKENKREVIWLLNEFYDYIMYVDNKNLPNMQIIEPYVDGQIKMYEAMSEYYDYLALENKKNERLLRAIKKVKGKTFYKYLTEIIEESEGIQGLAEIVSKPTGKYQEEDYGRTIKGIWIEEWSVGMDGDSYNGTVCVQLKPNKFLKFNYSI